MRWVLTLHFVLFRFIWSFATSSEITNWITKCSIWGFVKQKYNISCRALYFRVMFSLCFSFSDISRVIFVCLFLFLRKKNKTNGNLNNNENAAHLFDIEVKRSRSLYIKNVCTVHIFAHGNGIKYDSIFWKVLWMREREFHNVCVRVCVHVYFGIYIPLSAHKAFLVR